MTKKHDTTILQRDLKEWFSLSVLLLLIGAGFTFAHLAESSRQQMAERERLQVLTALLASNIESDLAATSVALADVVRDYLGEAAEPGASRELPRRLAALAGAMPGVRAMVVLDRDGKALASSLPQVDGRDFSRRAYFQAIRSAPDAAMLYVSAPFLSIKNDLVIVAARMVPAADGSFGGLVLATLDPAYFIEKFRTAMYAPDVWALVIHGAGRQWLNYPSKGAIDGTDLDHPGTFFRRNRDSGLPSNILSGKVYTTGEQRLMALATIQPAALRMDRAIVIGLSRNEAAIGAPLRRQALAYTAVFCLLALCAAALLYWTQRRRAHLANWRAEQEGERQAMLAVSDSEARFRTLIEDAPLAIAILRGGHFIYSNPRYRALHGYGADDDLKGLPWRAMIAAESRATLADNEALIEADSASEQRFEAIGLGKQGLPVPVFKTTARVLLADGPATLIFAQDISAQKRAEQEMLLARDAAEAANRGKAQFLANMSHEIRSPLNAILGMAWLLERARLQPDALDMTRKIRAAGQSLLSIVNDVLDVSKIEAGHMRIEQAPFRLADVIDKVAAGMGVAAADKPLELLIRAMPEGIDNLLGDALRLEQVLINLTSNAIKFTAAGRVELHVTLAERDGDALALRFCVRDSGIGIAPDMREAIFSAFTQADNSTTRRFGGTGLGLTICRQLVQLMGGTLTLDSMLGKGSEFCFTLPLRQIAGGTLSSPDMIGLQLLLVGDSAPALDAAGALARGLGWRALALGSGAAALAHVRGCDADAYPGVVLLDWKMPGMDGMATARELRRMLPPQRCPIIIMASTYALAELAGQADVALVDALLSKPLTASSLYNAVLEAQQRRAGLPGPSSRGAGPERSALQGICVLVVDDSEINRDVVRRILDDQGALTVFAHDGRQALDWLCAHPEQADIVLMDVQMPVMDGIEATRQLRKLAQFDDLPVIALTAGAFKEQQAAALQAGMTAFISKPFDVPSTIALIARLRRRRPGAVPETQVKVEVAREHAPDSALDLEQAMAQWLDLVPYRQHARRFATTYGASASMIRTLLHAGEADAAAAQAHKLCGVAASLALPATQRAARDVESILRAGADPADALRTLERELTRAARAIAGEFDAAAPELASRATDVPSALPFDRLRAALDEDNPAPAEALLVEFALALPAAALAPLRERLCAFDFRGAEMALEQLAAEYERNAGDCA